MWGIMWGVTTNFNPEDWWTLERARPVLVETVKFRPLDARRDPGFRLVSARISGHGGSF